MQYFIQIHRDIKNDLYNIKKKVQLYFRYFDTHYMKRTGRRSQPMEGNGIVYDDITKTGPPTSDAHLYRPTRLRQIQINAVTITVIHTVVLNRLINQD